MVLLASAYDQSKYFRAEDVTQEKKLRIEKVTEELVGVGANQEKKLVVWFTNSQKGLALNRTNNRTIRSAYGDDTAGWKNKVIVVFPTHADYHGRLVPALRVRIPPPKVAPSNNGGSPSDNGQTAKTPPDRFAQDPPTRPIPASDPAPDVDDFDDEIEF
jgi:hypothetical protein